MNLLAIDTSTERASIALKVGDEPSCIEQDHCKTHAQLILPIINQLLAKHEVKLNQLDGIVFGRGPGSFTGLRIACSIAKGLAYGHDLPLMPVSSLGSIAYRVREDSDQFCSTLPVLAVMDARMQELYWCYFSESEFIAKEGVNAPEHIVVPAEQSIILAGVGIELYWSLFPESIKSKVKKRMSIYPSAEVMIRLALQEGIEPVTPALAEPVYVRNQVVQGGLNG